MSGPIRKGEVWEIFGMVQPDNNLSAGKNVFFRSEIWITPLPGDSQSGVRPDLTRQSGPGNIGNMTPEERSVCVFREGTYVWTANAFGPRYVKYFGAAAGSNIQPGDQIGIDQGYVTVKRYIPTSLL